MEKPRLGLIGTGIMGVPMARNLLRAGYPLCVHSRTRAKAKVLETSGAQWRDSPAKVVADVDVVISIVSDSPDVEAVYLGEQGVLHGITQPTLCIDMSTISPSVARRVAKGLAEKESSFLDAPVSGGANGAEQGKLVIMVGGDGEAVTAAQPIFDVLGKLAVHCGPVGHGQLTKLCNQILCGLNLLGVCEALSFAKSVGLEPATMLQAVSGGAAGSWALENLGQRMIAGDFAPMFMVDLQQKDLRLALEAASSSATPLPGTALVSQLLIANQAAGEGREGTQAMLKILERLAGG